jgi:hypothetical protein
VGAVAFQAELVFEGVEDGLDPLADPTQVAEPGRLVGPVGADQPRVRLRDHLLERPAGEALSPRMTMPGRRMGWRAAWSNSPSATSRPP